MPMPAPPSRRAASTEAAPGERDGGEGAEKLAASQHHMARLIRAAKQHAHAEVAAAELASVTVHEHTPPSPLPAKPRPWLHRLWARIVALLLRLVGKDQRALPSPPLKTPLPLPEEPDDFEGFDPAAQLPLVEHKVLENTLAADSARLDAQQVKTALAECRAREAALAATVAERQQALARHRDARCTTKARSPGAALRRTRRTGGARARRARDTRRRAAVGAAQARRRDRRAPDAGDAGHDGGDARSRVQQADPQSPPDLLRALGVIRRERSTRIARRIAAALCLCRDRISELERRARHAHEDAPASSTRAA